MSGYVRRWVKVLAVVVAAVVVVMWVARSVQARNEAALTDALVTRARQQPLRLPDRQSLERLPAPVQRYLDHALPVDRRGLRLVRYSQAGVLRTDPLSERWMPFTAVQVTGPGIMEFQWTARATIAPLLHVQVRDSFIGGRGAGRVALLSAIPVASAGGSVEMNSGALHRFLAEAVWYPSALLPSTQLTWTPVDDTRAVATLVAGSMSVSLEFRFNAANEVTGIYTPGRWGSFGGVFKRVGWEGMFRRYSRRQGVLVPTEGEVGWYVDGQWRSVWRGTVESASMEFE